MEQQVYFVAGPRTYQPFIQSTCTVRKVDNLDISMNIGHVVTQTTAQLTPSNLQSNFAEPRKQRLPCRGALRIPEVQEDIQRELGARSPYTSRWSIDFHDEIISKAMRHVWANVARPKSNVARKTWVNDNVIATLNNHAELRKVASSMKKQVPNKAHQDYICCLGISLGQSLYACHGGGIRENTNSRKRSVDALKVKVESL